MLRIWNPFAMTSESRKDPNPSQDRARVAVDLTAFGEGGVSGGLKPFVFHLLQWIARERADEFAFVYFTRPPLVPEVEAFRRDADWQVCVGLPQTRGARAGLAWAADAEAHWTGAWPADLLYSPWGLSGFHRPEIPLVSLAADTLHRDWPGLLPGDEVVRREEWFQRMVQRAAAVQCNSEFVRRQLQSHFGAPSAKLFVVLNSIQDDILGASGRARTAAPMRSYFLYPANDWPHKNHDRLLAAYSDYRRKEGDGAWDLVLTGHFARAGAWLPRLETLGISGSCRVMGHLGREEFAGVFRNAGALVFPSLYEGFGIPVLEAMALGVPVTCGNLASVPEVAGDAALYFDPRRTADIAAAMSRITSEAGLRKRLARAGLERAKGFSISREAGLLADKFASLALRR